MEQSLSTEKLSCRLMPLLFWAAIFILVGTTQAQNFAIVDIRVNGNINASEKMITNVAALRIGSELTGTAIQDAVRNLYAKGIFRDISVDVEQVNAGTVVIINVLEYPKLTAITFEGNKQISDKDLKSITHLAVGGYIADHLARLAKNKIDAEYMSKGYFLADVLPEILYEPDSSRAAIRFKIKEYNKVKVETVVLSGAMLLDSAEVVGNMSNRKRGLFRSSDFKKEKFPEDREKIIAYCNKEGFIDAYIKSDSFAIDTARNRMTIFIDLYEGPQYYFGETGFSGNDIFADQILNKALSFDPGEVFNQEKYDESLGELYAAYQEEGYLRVRIFDDRRTRDSTIDIEYDITEGLPSQVKLIDITGNTKTKEKVIRRELRIRPGETFKRSALMRSLRDVMQLNFFSDVVPDVRDLPSGDVDLIIKVEEKPTGQVSAGAGYSAQDKLVGTFGLGIPNFRGMGQSVNLNVEFGSERNSISLGFTEPWFMGTPTLIGGSIYNVNRNWYDDFTEGKRGGSVRLGRRLRWPDNYTKVFWGYRIEDVRYYKFEDAYRAQNGDTVINSLGETEYVPFESSLETFNEEWLRTSATYFSIERDSRDLPVFATSGSQVAYTGELAGGILGGRWEYYKHLFSAKKYIPLKWGIALAAKYKFGYISADDIDDIPYSERFTPGGVDTDGIVRGYSDASLAPRNSNGTYTPGISEVIYNLELQFPIMTGQMYVIGFADAGSAWSAKKQIQPFSDLYRSVGIGFRLVVPGVGVIGFDFGYALDEAYGSPKGWKTHFQVSPGY
ncbi:MAG: outer membrane protein assembly factor BamA [FCB group bacterium]|nr:outer membrane protein assembly factor BamA [FCB group bacterium]